MSTHSQDVARTTEDFRRLVLDRCEERVVPRANKLSDKIWRLAHELRESPDGRKAIEALLDDLIPDVRLVAAAHALAWTPSAARRVLEQLRDSGGRGSFEAKWTLIEFDKGRLHR